MKTHHFPIIRLAAPLLMLAATILAPHGALAASHEGTLPEVNDLQDHIVSENPYTTWELWPGTEKLYEGSQPHGAFLTTYVNGIAMKSLQKDEAEFAAGSIIVKENYTPDKKLAAVTVMYKKTGYNPTGGDWYWLKYAPDGTVQADGKVNSCLGCHRAKMAQDWVFTERP